MTTATPAAREQAVAELLAVAKGQEFGPRISPALATLTEATYADGLALQLDVLAAWEAQGQVLGGWKIGLTSREARDSMGVGRRPHGYVLADRILASGARLAEPVPHCRLEPEIGVILGRDLAGEDVTVEQARAAVVSVAPAFEINSGRVPTSASRAVRLGNALNNWGIVFGPELPVGTIDLAALTVEIGNENGPIATGDSTPATIDDPFLSLTRVCRELAGNGRGLRAGQRLITGSLTAAVPTDGAHEFYADFGSLGGVTLRLA